MTINNVVLCTRKRSKGNWYCYAGDEKVFFFLFKLKNLNPVAF